MKLKTPIIALIVLLLLIGSAVALAMAPQKPGKYDDFARCLGEKGATFYGAFWCPHCHDQKAMFGKSAKYLPYEECSTPDSQGQLQICTDKGVKSYPTWIFANGEVQTGTLSFATLAEKTGCTAPQN